ncbi:MAG: biosynthetic arginine decarboxylase [Acidobacteriota bacterium]|nr:MAG: biosynthetic arginine decarboxylase [Acidobacteriota bacterium]
MARLAVEDALDMFGIARWGDGLFGISPSGQLTVRPTGDPRREVVLASVVEQLRSQGFNTPLVFRFPQILARRVEQLTTSFQRAMREFAYDGAPYLPVYPLKVNQLRGVVDALLASGREHRLGLEVGSRSELMAALALELPDGALTVVNGYKDERTLRLAILGARIGRQIVVVIEKLREVDVILRMFEAAGEGPLPRLGVRFRLFARGSGKWWKSSGTTAKFGLSTAALLETVQRLQAAGRLDRLAMLHFHIGSQIPEIRRLKSAIREGARVYAKLRQLGAPVEILNVGGGLAVDYDGSKTASDASMNYSLAEYANDVVYTVKEVCSEEDVALPILVSESGRALTASHALLVTHVLGRISSDPPLAAELTAGPDAPRVVKELRALRDEIIAKTYREYYHDAVELRDEMVTLFNIGLIDLQQRAFAEQLFWQIARRALSHARREKIPLEEFEQLERALHDKYIANFSVFQSAPDHWALDQLFPVVPLTRLTEPPTRSATLVDITCDSDGEIDRFVDVKEVKEVLELHDPEQQPERPYDLAIMLLGAYQDVMGDMHNLFGAPDDVYVIVDEDATVRVTRIERGDTSGDVLRVFGYLSEELAARVRHRLDARVVEGVLTEAAARKLLEEYRALFDEGTYLTDA